MDFTPLKVFKAVNWQISFQEPATSLMLGIIDLHHTIFFYLIVIFVLVSWLLFCLVSQQTMTGFISQKALSRAERLAYEENPATYNFHHCSTLEIVWTLVPSAVIVAILIPSLSLLFSADEVVDPVVTLKVIGHQWYWSYEYSDFSQTALNNSLCFDSNLDADAAQGPYKDLLAVDEEVVLPVYTSIRFLITSEDVLHSWAIPSFGIKMDAIPGRLNQVVTSVYKTGFFYGQCSELCGVGHGFMPIMIRVVPLSEYLNWICSRYISEGTLLLPYSNSGVMELLTLLRVASENRESLAPEHVDHITSFSRLYAQDLDSFVDDLIVHLRPNSYSGVAELDLDVTELLTLLRVSWVLREGSAPEEADLLALVSGRDAQDLDSFVDNLIVHLAPNPSGGVVPDSHVEALRTLLRSKK